MIVSVKQLCMGSVCPCMGDPPKKQYKKLSLNFDVHITRYNYYP
jgi:hypothetical protein